jgi:hypothetical protein
LAALRHHPRLPVAELDGPTRQVKLLVAQCNCAPLAQCTSARGTSRSVPDRPMSSRVRIIHGAPADATTRRPRPAITTVSPPGLGLRCYDRLGGLACDYAEVASCG